jgi:hypothetical protein
VISLFSRLYAAALGWWLGLHTAHDRTDDAYDVFPEEEK